jgi:hypothetical protein
MKWIGTSLRAIFAGLVAFGTALTTVLVDDASIGDLTDGQWLIAALGALIAFGGVWGITNKPA